jgi:hypothetical protein
MPESFAVRRKRACFMDRVGLSGAATVKVVARLTGHVLAWFARGSVDA